MKIKLSYHICGKTVIELNSHVPLFWLRESLAKGVQKPVPSASTWHSLALQPYHPKDMRETHRERTGLSGQEKTIIQAIC